MAKKADRPLYLVGTTHGPHERGLFSLSDLTEEEARELYGASVFRLAVPQDQAAELRGRLDPEHEGVEDELMADLPAQAVREARQR